MSHLLMYPEFEEREPNDTDNPYVVIEHILACREQWIEEDWHKEYIDNILSGFLAGNVYAALGIVRGGGGDSYSQWKIRHRNLLIIVDAMKRVDKGAVLNGVDDYGVFIQMSNSGKYTHKNGENLEPKTIQTIVYDYIKKHP